LLNPESAGGTPSVFYNMLSDKPRKKGLKASAMRKFEYFFFSRMEEVFRFPPYGEKEKKK
jgi:hypothetical protein